MAIKVDDNLGTGDTDFENLPKGFERNLYFKGRNNHYFYLIELRSDKNTNGYFLEQEA